MDATTLTAALLIGLPLAFNALFFELGQSFDYPRILRQPAPVILSRFSAGGRLLILRWWLLMLTALLLLPLVVLVGIVFISDPPENLSEQATIAYFGCIIGAYAVGVPAALVQAVGLSRWPFVVPELARRHVAAEEGPTGDAERAAIEVVFVALHRFLGIAVGEHLGYLLTGAWTLFVAGSVLLGTGIPVWLGVAGLVIGAALIVGSLEFVGRTGDHGWLVAERLVPVAYIGWSFWLIVFGVLLLLG